MRNTLAIAFLLFLACAGQAFAHSCVDRANKPEKEFRDLLAKERAIFYGEIIALDAPINSYTQQVRIRVFRSWSGDIAPEVSAIYTGAYYSFEKEIGGVGTRKIFYAETATDGGLSISFCEFQGARMDDRMKEFLGEGREIQAEQTLTADEPSFWGWLWNKIAGIFKT